MDLLDSYNYTFNYTKMEFIFKLCCGNDRDPQPPLEEPPPRSPSRAVVPTPARKQSNSTRDKEKRRQSSNHQRESTLGSQQRIKVDRYEGQSMEDLPHGNGSMLYANGDFYRGEWVMGKKEGRGLQIYQEGGVQYQGQWQNDKQHGNGKLVESSGSYYQGQFQNGLKDGKGHYHDNVQKKIFTEEYQNGTLMMHKEVSAKGSKEDNFPSLALDKERFNTEDLNHFESRNPDIKEYDLSFFLKYYHLSKIAKMYFAPKQIKDWTIREVIDFLDGVDLKQYKEVFYKNKIKGKDLITLNQQELKNDLGLKMGDRKRFLNYIIFLTEADTTSDKKDKKRRRDQVRKNSLKFGSSRSMKRVLDNIKSIPIYEESIKEEMDYSSQSQKKSQKSKGKKDQSSDKSESERDRYGSAAQCYSPARKSNECFSLQQKMSADSERSSGKNLPLKRKDSKDNGIEHSSSHHFQQIIKKDSCHKLEGNVDKEHRQMKEHREYRLSDQHKNQQNQRKDKQSVKSSSSSSIDSIRELTRKKTQVKSHQNSQIRELYQFLKQHRSLQFLIKEKDIQKLELIGEGGYGQVFRGKYIGQEIAIKDYLKTKRHRHKEDFMKELMIISDLKHPNIVLYMGICITADKFILVTQYMENGSLFDQLHQKNNKKKFTDLQRIEIVYEIVKGMVYLHHMKKILHRDLKSSNVLIGDQWNVVKLCDFGLAGQKKKQRKHKRVGTYQWMAPEVIRGEDKIDEKADVYSFGVIVWEVLTEKIPYEGLSQNQIVGLVGYDKNHQLDYPEVGSPLLIDIMKQSLNKDQDERPSFIQIQNQFEEHFKQEQKMRKLLQKRNQPLKMLKY